MSEVERYVWFGLFALAIVVAVYVGMKFPELHELRGWLPPGLPGK